jgi:hypothetical protein
MRHPDERQIALYAGGEAGWIEGLSIRRHLAQCRSCGELANAYRRDREAIRQEAETLPPGMNWERVAAEMTGNIRVGLAAGECVSNVRAKSHRFVWRPGFAAAGLALLLIAGWFLNFPADDRARLAHNLGRLFSRPVAAGDAAVSLAGVSLEATRNGIQVSENGSALTMMNPGNTPAVVVVNTRGSLRARYVDDDTGQVTITNVYAH